MGLKNKIIVLLIFIVGITLYTSCNKSPNEPEKKESSSPQVDIPWPSLADTPWPMNHHDPQSTGRSPYLGPTLGVVENKIPLYGIEGSLALDNDNNIYITNSYPPIKLHSFGIDAQLNWAIDLLGSSSCTPLLGKDSTIYFHSGVMSSLIALNYNGTIKWEYQNDNRIYNLGINIGLDGTIYFIDAAEKLKAISSTGKLLWELADSRFQIHRYGGYGVGSFSPDGKYLYVQGKDVSLIAVNVETRNIEWEFGEFKLESTPIVDNDGNIYLFQYEYLENKSLYSLNSRGNVNWTFNYGYDFRRDNVEPTLDYNGNIYFGDDTLYSVNYKGELRWAKSLDKKRIISPLLSDIENNIYIGTISGGYPSPDPIRHYVISYTSKGEINWELEINDERALGASAAISNDGHLVYPTFRAWNILIIK